MRSRRKSRSTKTEARFLREVLRRLDVRGTAFARERSSRSAKALLVSDFEGTMNALARANEEASRRVRKSCRVQLLHLDLAVCVTTKLVLLVADVGDRPLVWPEMRGDVRARNLMVKHLLATLCNSLLAIRSAATAGLHLSVKVLFRAHVELAEILVGVLGDEDFCSKYKAWPGTLDRVAQDYWKTHIAPGRVRVVLERVLARSGLDEQHAKEVSQVRRDAYTWLSAHAHAHPIAVALGAYDHEPTARVVKTSLGGRGGAWVKDALNRVALYNVELIMLILALTTKQGWTPEASQTESRDLWDLMRLEYGLMYRLTRRVARSRPSRAFEADASPGMAAQASEELDDEQLT